VPVGSRIFSTASSQALGPTQPHIHWVPGLKRQERDADQSPSANIVHPHTSWGLPSGLFPSSFPTKIPYIHRFNYSILKSPFFSQSTGLYIRRICIIDDRIRKGADKFLALPIRRTTKRFSWMG
jgi:hypothetical protein